MSTSPIPYTEFAKQIKEKYPAYASQDDRALAQAMLEKFPVYKGRVRFDSGGATGSFEQPSFVDKAKSFVSGVGDTMKSAAKNLLNVEGLGGGDRVPIDPKTGEPRVDLSGGLSKAFKDDPYRAAGSVLPYAVTRAPKEVTLPGMAEKTSVAASAVAGTLPKVHPVAKFLIKRIPGGGTAMDVLDVIREKYGTSLESVPKVTRDELANQLYKEKHGNAPKTAQERVDAIKEFKETLKPAAAPKEAKPAVGKGTGTKYGGPVKPEFTKPPGRSARSGINRAMEDVETGGGKGAPAVKPERKVAAAAAPTSAEPPRADLDPREIGFSRVAAQAQAKDMKVAQRLIDKGLTIEKVMAMPEDQLNVHVRAAGFQPFRGKGLSRSVAAGRADIVKAMKSLMSGGAK